MQTAAARRSRRRLAEMAGLCALVALIVLLAFQLLEPLRKFSADVGDRIVTSQPTYPLDDFVFVAIDDPSIKMDHLWPEDYADSPPLQAMARGWPWPRDVYAAAIERLLAADARVVLLDLILDAERPGDTALRATLDRHPDRITLGANIAEDGSAAALRVPAPTLVANGREDDRVGFVNFWPEPDGVVRSAVYRTRQGIAHADATEFQSLAARTLSQLGFAETIPADESRHAFRFGDLSTLTVVPFYSVLFDPDWQSLCQNGTLFRDKIVVIGPSAAILQDFHLTPLGTIPGPLLHLNAVAATMRGAFYHPPDFGLTALLVVLAATAAWLITRRFRQPVSAILLLVGVGVGYFAFVFGVAHAFDVLLETLQPTTTLLLAGVACIAWNFAAERRESGRLRSTLDRYVSRNVVREILDHRDDFLTALGGTRRPMTVFFSDVRGFTTFSESHDATAVVTQLNEYLAEMVRIIFAHNGTVDKFMGDGIMAVWGNVISQGHAADARQAALATVEMQASLAHLNADWATRGLPPFAIGIGLHHGDAVFGNIGSTEKMEPTVIGDAVNLASRVEGLTKKYGVTTCVSGPCADLIRGEFPLRTVDLVQVVGKSHPVEIFTLVDATDEWPSAWEQGITHYRNRQFAEAADHFQAAPESDKLRNLYLTRCTTFSADPPPDGWDGTEIATTK